MTLTFVDDSFFHFNVCLNGLYCQGWHGNTHLGKSTLKAWVYLELGSKIILTTLVNMLVLLNFGHKNSQFSV